MFGCEAWILTFKEKNKFLITDIKVIRKMSDMAHIQDGSWRVRKNVGIILRQIVEAAFQPAKAHLVPSEVGGLYLLFITLDREG